LKEDKGKSNYSVGKKYCRKYEVCLYHEGMFVHVAVCMQLRLTSSNREDKERPRQQRRVVWITNENN
jgi:hypothetical protein